MDTVSYSKDEKIRLLEANGYVVRKGKVAVIENNIPSVSKESFAFKAGRKYDIDTVFDSTVKSIMLMINPGGGGEEDEGGFYTAGLGIDITGAVISVSHLGFENLVDPGADKIMVWDNMAGALGWDEITLTSKIKVSSNDTTPGYLENKLALSYGGNVSEILELSTISEGANETRILQIDETKISHSNIDDLGNDDHLQYALLAGRNGDVLLIDEINEGIVGAGVIIEGIKLIDSYIDFPSNSLELRASTSRVFSYMIPTVGTLRIGYGAGNDSMTGLDNILVGEDVGMYITTGKSNVFIGSSAGIGVNGQGTHDYNVAIGVSGLLGITTGNENIAIGRNSLAGLTTGTANIGIGSYAGSVINSTFNTYIGNYAGRYATHGHNTFIGSYAGQGVSGQSTGYNNVFLGYQAGDSFTTGMGNILIGHGIDLTSPTTNYQFRLGYNTINLLEGSMISGSEWIGTDYIIKTDFMNEYNAGVGVTIEGLKLIDSYINFPPGTLPGSPIEGDVKYDSATHKLRCYNGSSWNDLY